MSPKEIVNKLDEYVVGQSTAKRMVAIAICNRERRINTAEDIREEILPSNILMVGDTGVGKTEISRRIANIIDAPMVKVEATKFTEVGYVGKDVEQIIRDLTEIAMQKIKSITVAENNQKIKENADQTIIDLLVGQNASLETRALFYAMLKRGELNDREVEINVPENTNPAGEMNTPFGAQMGIFNIGEMIGKLVGTTKGKTKKMKVPDAMKVIIKDEEDKFTDKDYVANEAIRLVENKGIVFIDEIDKLCMKKEGSGRGPDVSREGVQRDLLPIIEGTVVPTKYGNVKTDHILFITAGAFHNSKISDLMPELQGRLPVLIHLDKLTKDDFYQILTKPKYNLIRQNIEMMKTIDVNLIFEDSGILEIASVAYEANNIIENLGARRLVAVMNKVLEDLSFDPDLYKGQDFIIDSKYVKKIFDNVSDNDWKKYIL